MLSNLIKFLPFIMSGVQMASQRNLANRSMQDSMEQRRYEAEMALEQQKRNNAQTELYDLLNKGASMVDQEEIKARNSIGNKYSGLMDPYYKRQAMALNNYPEYIAQEQRDFNQSPFAAEAARKAAQMQMSQSDRSNVQGMPYRSEMSDRIYQDVMKGDLLGYSNKRDQKESLALEALKNQEQNELDRELLPFSAKRNALERQYALGSQSNNNNLQTRLFDLLSQKDSSSRINEAKASRTAGMASVINQFLSSLPNTAKGFGYKTEEDKLIEELRKFYLKRLKDKSFLQDFKNSGREES